MYYTTDCIGLEIYRCTLYPVLNFLSFDHFQWWQLKSTVDSLSFYIVDVASNPDLNTSESKGVPLLLILGYGNGVQVWNIAVRISQFGYGV